MSHGQVSRRTKATLLKHVLRAYTLAAANEPAYVAKDYDYMYDHDEARFTILGEDNGNFLSVVQKRFEDLQKATEFNYKWNETKFEVDHAMELQHVVRMLALAGHLDDEKWTKTRLTCVLHLGFYLNDQRNLWLIPAAINQTKSRIPLSSWYQNKTGFADKPNATEIAKEQKLFLQEYLFAYATKNGQTPFTELLNLSAEMSGLPETELTWLTKAAGIGIFSLLSGWCDSLGISKQLSVKTKNANNPEKSIADLLGHEKQFLQKKRNNLLVKAEKGEALFASDVDKIRHSVFDNVTKKFIIPADDAFSTFQAKAVSKDKDDDAFDDL